MSYFRSTDRNPRYNATLIRSSVLMVFLKFDFIVSRNTSFKCSMNFFFEILLMYIVKGGH